MNRKPSVRPYTVRQIGTIAGVLFGLALLWLTLGCSTPTEPCTDINDPRIEWTARTSPNGDTVVMIGTCGDVTVR